jgi:hypothetical protein
VQLVGDSASPGADKFYGTDGGGAKGWRDAPSRHVQVTFQDEGVGLGTAGTVDTVDFVGAGVSVARVGNKVTVTIGGGGGGGSPGGSDTQVQFNDSGAFAGAANLLVRSGGQIALADTLDWDTVAAPAAPAAGKVRQWGRLLAGRALPYVTTPAGIRYAMQSSLWGRNVGLWRPNTTTTLSTWGMSVGTVVGTGSTPTPASTNIFTASPRALATSAAAANSGAGWRGTQPQVWRGNGAGRGGFWAFFTFGCNALNTDGQFAVGLSSSTTALGGNPSGIADMLGFIKDSGDTNWQFCRRTGGGAAVKVDLGVAPAAQQMFDMMLFCAPNASEIFVRIVQLAWSGDTVLLDTSYSTDLPTNTAFLAPRVEARTTTLTAAVGVTMNTVWLEADQ